MTIPCERSIPSPELRIERRRLKAREVVRVFREGSLITRKEVTRELSRKSAAFVGAVIFEAAVQDVTRCGGASLAIQIAEYLARERWNEGCAS